MGGYQIIHGRGSFLLNYKYNIYHEVIQ